MSTLIIYMATKLFGQSEGMDAALPAALIGAIVYAVTYLVVGHGLYAALISGFVWLFALSTMYRMSFLRSVGVALVVWVVAALVGVFVPTLVGPL